MFLASSRPLGSPLEGLLGRLWAFLGRPEAILGRLGVLPTGLAIMKEPRFAKEPSSTVYH